MKRTFLSIILILIAPALIIAGGQKAKDEKISLSVEMSVYVEAPHKKAFEMLKEAYEQKNPNVEIVYYGSAYAEFWDKLTTEIVASTEADVVQLQGGGTRYATYAALRKGETGAFVNLDEYIKGASLENNLIGQQDLKYNGHYIGISNYAMGMRGVYFRKSMFEEAGIDPTSIITNEDFLNAAKTITKQKADGTMQYGFGAVLSTHSFVWDEMKTFICRPIGGNYTLENKGPYTPEKVIIDGPEMKYAFQWWQEMIFKHKVVAPGSYGKADERDLFWNGTVAMNIDGPWFVGMTRDYKTELLNDLGVMASPDVVYKGKQYPFHYEKYTITHLISSNSKHSDAAWEFLEWMTTFEAQEMIAESGMIPANKEYSNSESYMKKVPLNAELVALAEDRYYEPPVIDPNIPEAGEMSRIMIDAAQEAFISGDDVGAVLDKAANKVRDVFRK